MLCSPDDCEIELGWQKNKHQNVCKRLFDESKMGGTAQLTCVSGNNMSFPFRPTRRRSHSRQGGFQKHSFDDYYGLLAQFVIVTCI